MIYVTHDQVEALTLGQRIAVMKEGVIQQVADPMMLYRQPANLFVAGFIGSPPMNIFQGMLSAKGDTLFFEEQAGNTRAVPTPFIVRLDIASVPPLRGYLGKPVALGIRPEDVACLSPQPKNPPEGALEAVVEVIQPMGSETYLHLASHAHSFVARVRATELFSVNQRVWLAFDMPHAHFFDPASRKTLA